MSRNRRFRAPIEQLEDRSVPSVATAYVDDNWALVTDNGVPGLSVGDEVRNDNDTINTGGISAIYGINAFGTVTSGPGITGPTSVPGDATINDAIANTTAGGTVNVLEGSYDEKVDITKALSLIGAQANVAPVAGGRGAESIITGAGGTNSISVESDNVVVNGFEVADQLFSITTNDQDAGGVAGAHQNVQISYNYVHSTVASAGIVLGFNVNNLLNSSFTNYTVSHNLVNVSNTSTPDNSVAAIGLGASAPSGGSVAYNNLNISNNDLSNAGGYEIFAGGDPAVMSFTGAVIAQNNIHDGGAGINIARAGNISIRQNTFQNLQYTSMQVGIVGGEIVGNTFSQIAADNTVGFGDVIQLWGGQFNTSVSTNVNITNNVIHFNDVTGATDPTRGIRLRPPGAGTGIDGTTIHIHDNAFLNGGVITDGSAFAIVNQGTATTPVDASGNWWSTTSETAIAALMSGLVDFTPYLNSGTDGAGVGFQGDFSVLNVTSLGSQTGTSGRIQEGIDSVTAGGTVLVKAGTYNENVTLKSGVTLAPAGASGVTGVVNTGNLNLSTGALAVDVNGTAAGTGYDQLNVTGTVTLGGTLKLNGLSAVPAGTSILLINNDGTDAVNGTFAGLPEGATVTATNGQQFTISYSGGTGNDVVLVAPVPAVPPPAPTPVHLFAVAAGNGVVTVYNAGGSLRAQGDPFGGLGRDVRVATGDLNGDGVDDIVLAVGSGPLAGLVMGIDGATLTLLGSLFAFPLLPGSGASVAIGDVTGDGRDDLVLATASGASLVQAYDIAAGGTLVADFLAFPGFTGGVNVAVADVDGTGPAEIIAGVASNGPPVVAVYDTAGQLRDAFLAYGFPYSGGVNVAAGDVIGDDGQAEILVAPASGGAFGLVELFSFGNHSPVLAGNLPLTVPDTGLRVAVNDVNGDGKDDVILGAGPGGSRVIAADLRTLTALLDFDAFPGYLGGVFIG